MMSFSFPRSCSSISFLTTGLKAIAKCRKELPRVERWLQPLEAVATAEEREVDTLRGRSKHKPSLPSES